MSRPSEQIFSLTQAVTEFGLNIDTAFAKRTYLKEVLAYIRRLEHAALYAVSTLSMLDEMRETHTEDALLKLEKAVKS